MFTPPAYVEQGGVTLITEKMQKAYISLFKYTVHRIKIII
jgi:hypothetical protein